MKELEGKEVYLKPTGNNARYAKNEISKGTIVKVARVFVTLKLEGLNYERKYRFNGNKLSDGGNGGYIVFPDEQVLNDYNEVLHLSDKIANKYSYSRDYQNVELGKLRKIAELLDVT